MTEIENRLINYNYIRKLAVFLKKENLIMIFDSYGVLNHYQVELIEDTLKDCLKYLGEE